jgi:hypothetical protein
MNWARRVSAVFGPAVLRVAETIAHCRVPIRGFIDIGAGTGWLLDALEVLLPDDAHTGIEGPMHIAQRADDVVRIGGAMWQGRPR